MITISSGHALPCTKRRNGPQVRSLREARGNGDMRQYEEERNASLQVRGVLGSVPEQCNCSTVTLFAPMLDDGDWQ